MMHVDEVQNQWECTLKTKSNIPSIQRHITSLMHKDHHTYTSDSLNEYGITELNNLHP